MKVIKKYDRGHKNVFSFIGILWSQNLKVMDQTISHLSDMEENSGFEKKSKFFTWCESQNDYKFLWAGVVLFGQIGAIVPITAISIGFFGNNSLILWILMFFFNVPVFALNLAAQPLKYTIPALIFATVGSLSLVIASFASYFL